VLVPEKRLIAPPPEPPAVPLVPVVVSLAPLPPPAEVIVSKIEDDPFYGVF
jgi:hypothetical protein